jgi:hypothetical protein
MKNITVQCDRCGKLVEGCLSIDGMSGGFYDVTSGYWQKFQRWDEQTICDKCMWDDPKYVAMYVLPPVS